MLQAAAAGAVDFRRADPRDPGWRTYLQLVTYSVEKTNLATLKALEAQHAFALLTRADLTDQGYKHYLAESDRLINAVRKRLFPWVDVKDKDQDKTFKDLEELWVKEWGDPRDPETAAKIDATAAALRRGDRSLRR